MTNGSIAHITVKSNWGAGTIINMVRIKTTNLDSPKSMLSPMRSVWDRKSRWILTLRTSASKLPRGSRRSNTKPRVTVNPWSQISDHQLERDKCGTSLFQTRDNIKSPNGTTPTTNINGHSCRTTIRNTGSKYQRDTSDKATQHQAWSTPLTNQIISWM